MKRVLLVTAGVGCLVVLAGLVLVWVLRAPKLTNSAPAGPVDTKVGTYAGHSYVINQVGRGTERTAVFDPAIPGDDAQVVGALKTLTDVTFGSPLPDELQPQVEVLNESQYITFNTELTKTVFQISTNQQGSVWGVRFWQEQHQWVAP